MKNSQIQTKFGFTIQDAEFKKNFIHLLTEPFLAKYIELMGKPEDYPDLARYYEILSFALLGFQLAEAILKEKEDVFDKAEELRQQ